MASDLCICRACLKSCTNCVNLQTYFQYNEEEKGNTTTEPTSAINYLECLRFCTKLPIDDNNGEPKYLCSTCASELQIVYKFLKKVQNSQSILEKDWDKQNVPETEEQLKFSMEKYDSIMSGDLISVKIELAGEDSSGNDDTFDMNNDKDNEEEHLISSEYDQDELQYLPEYSKILKNNSNDAITKNYKCHVCNRTYTTAYLLKTHLKYHERKNLGNKSDACVICGKQFSTQRYLIKHMIVHQNSREPQRCDYCNKEYITKTALNIHKRVHKGETLKCIECGKPFTRSYELKIHMRFHNREFPFRCMICNKKFVIKGHLRSHMLQHQGVKLECEECGKLFSSTKALNEHSYTHSEMPFPCQFCSKAYPSKQKYKVHLNNIHFSEMKEIDMSTLQRVSNLKKRKRFNYVQVMEEEEVENHKKFYHLESN